MILFYEWRLRVNIVNFIFLRYEKQSYQWNHSLLLLEIKNDI